MAYRIANEKTRKAILDALCENRYRIYSDGQRYLNHKGIRTGPLIKELIECLTQFEIFELQKRNSGDRQKYQFVIRYEDPEILIHVKFVPMEDDPPLIFLGFHTHNTGYAPLPLILIPDDPDTDESSSGNE